MFERGMGEVRFTTRYYTIAGIFDSFGSFTLLSNFSLQVWSWFENINKLLDAMQFYIIFDICVIVAICFYYDGFYYTNADYIMFYRSCLGCTFLSF